MCKAALVAMRTLKTQTIKRILLKKVVKEMKTRIDLTCPWLLSALSCWLLMLNSHSPSTEKHNVFPQGTALKTFTCLREPTLLEMKEEPSCLYKINVKWAPQRFLFIPLNLSEEENNYQCHSAASQS